jgi:dolichol-phosphate mannosyltransferase
MEEKCLLTVVSPVYRGEKMVHELVRRIKESVSLITDNYNVILVNDCSPDDSWSMILKECEEDSRVKGINLSRNFGQHNAITAGLSFSKGDWVVVLDCDLQDRPEEIPNLYNKAMEGYDIVYAQRLERNDKCLKRLSSSMFHAVFNFLSGANTDKSISNFGVYRKDVIDAYVKMPERFRGFGSLVRYLGFKSTAIPVEHATRLVGKSSYSLQKLLKQAFSSIVSNTNKPLKIMIGMGFFIAAISMIIALYNIIARFCGIISVPGFTTTVFSIWFVGGLNMMQLGVLGVYIGRIFDQVKGRPIYVIRDKVNIDS